MAEVLLLVEEETVADNLPESATDETEASVVAETLTVSEGVDCSKQSFKIISPAGESNRSLLPRTPTGNSVFGKFIMGHHP